MNIVNYLISYEFQKKEGHKDGMIRYDDMMDGNGLPQLMMACPENDENVLGMGKKNTGRWFGTCFIFPMYLDLSSQLTNIFQRG